MKMTELMTRVDDVRKGQQAINSIIISLQKVLVGKTCVIKSRPTKAYTIGWVTERDSLGGGISVLLEEYNSHWFDIEELEIDLR